MNGTLTLIIDLVALNLLIYDMVKEARDDFPVASQDIQIYLDEAEHLVWAVPEHNGGIPLVVTNLIAWLSRTLDIEHWRTLFKDKPTTIAPIQAAPAIRSSPR